MFTSMGLLAIDRKIEEEGIVQTESQPKEEGSLASSRS